MTRAALRVSREPPIAIPSDTGPTLTPSTNNPITTQLGSTLTTFGDVVYDSSGNNFHLFVMVDGASAGIYEITGNSPDSFNIGTATRVLAPGTQTWEDLTVGVATAWKEGTTWYLLYRATGSGHSGCQIGLASRTGSSGSFSRASTTPVVIPTLTWEDTTIESGPGRLIKVASTYYLFYSNVEGPAGLVRQNGVATSTDLLTWTKDASNPILGGGRFCNSVWTEGGAYYSLCPYYLSTADSKTNFELWRSTSPQFYAADRTLVGVVFNASSGPSWSAASYDTPTLITDDITRSSWTCTGSRRVVYAGQDGSGNWLQGIGTLNHV